MNKWTEWSTLVTQYRNLGQRLGQSYMNALHDVDEELYNRIVGTHYDCFYDDSNYVHFMSFLMTEAKWE